MMFVPYRGSCELQLGLLPAKGAGAVAKEWASLVTSGDNLAHECQAGRRTKLARAGPDKNRKLK